MNIPSFSFRGSVPSNYNKKVNANPEENTLVRSPGNDTVAFRGKEGGTVISCREADNMRYDINYTKRSFWKNDYKMLGDDVDLYVKDNGFTGNRSISGKGFGHDFDINISTKTFSLNNGKVTGKIDGNDIELKYNHGGNRVIIEGDMDSIQGEERALLTMLISDKVNYAIKQDQEAAMAMAIMR